MRAVVQRVHSAKVTVDGTVVGEIQSGLCVLLGIHTTDTTAQADWMIHKLVNLRIFADDDDKMNKSLLDINGGLLLVSQFTLYGDAQKGFRPSFIDAARPEIAEPLYNYMVEKLRNDYTLLIQTGKFGAMMDVSLTNTGPVTLLLEK